MGQTKVQPKAIETGNAKGQRKEVEKETTMVIWTAAVTDFATVEEQGKQKEHATVPYSVPTTGMALERAKESKRAPKWHATYDTK